MNLKRAKELRRKAKAVTEVGFEATVYHPITRMNPSTVPPKEEIIYFIVTPDCTRGIYLQLKKESK